MTIRMHAAFAYLAITGVAWAQDKEPWIGRRVFTLYGTVLKVGDTDRRRSGQNVNPRIRAGLYRSESTGWSRSTANGSGSRTKERGRRRCVAETDPARAGDRQLHRPDPREPQPRITSTGAIHGYGEGGIRRTPSPTTARPSGSTPRHALPTTTGATPGRTKKEYDKAIADYDEAIRLDPKVRHGVQQPGQRLVRQGGVRQGHRRLRRGHPARPRTSPRPTTTGATPGRPRRSTTRPSPTTTRPSGSTRRMPRPTTTGPGCGPPAPTRSIVTARRRSSRPPGPANCGLEGCQSPRHPRRRLCRGGRLRQGGRVAGEGEQALYRRRGQEAARMRLKLYRDKKPYRATE